MNGELGYVPEKMGHQENQIRTRKKYRDPQLQQTSLEAP